MQKMILMSENCFLLLYTKLENDSLNNYWLVVHCMNLTMRNLNKYSSTFDLFRKR